MKSIISALLIFSLLITITSCHNKSTAQESIAETRHTSTTSDSSSGTTSVSSSVSSSSQISSQISSSDTAAATSPDNSPAPPDISQQMSDSDYMAESPIPSVAWTEINFDKIMYTQSQCMGYEFALSDAHGKMIYNAGIGLEIIARTSTGYYRTINDYYIPCDFLDNNIPENVDPSVATSCTVAPPPAVTTAVSSIVTTLQTTTAHVN